MKRLFLVLVVLGAVTIAVPSLRERAQPRFERTRQWLGQTLERPLSPVLTPYRRLKTQTRIGKAGNTLVSRRNMGQDPPDPNEFQQFLIDQDLSEDGLDAWGTPLILRQRPDSVDIISAGPDFQYDTEDDLIVSIRYRDPGVRRRVRP